MKCFTALVRQWVIMCCVHLTTGPLSFMSLNMGTPSLNIYCSFYPILESKFLHLLNPCLILNANPSFKFISRCWGRRGKHEVFGEKKVPPPRPARIPAAKNKPDKERPQIQPKQETLTRTPPRKKKPHLPFSTFYVDFEEMTDDTSGAPKVDEQTHTKAPHKRPPPSRPVASKITSIKAPSSLHGDKEIIKGVLNSENVNSEPKVTQSSEAANIVDKPKTKARPPRPYSVATAETNLQDSSKQVSIEGKKTKPKPPRPRSLCEDVKITEQQIQAADIKSKALTREDPQVMQGDGDTKELAPNTEKTPAIVEEIEKSKPKPNRPAPVGPEKTKTKRSRPAQLVSR